VTRPNGWQVRSGTRPAQPAEHFCTYFDHRYAAKGLAMWKSLKKHRPSAALHVLCLDDACQEILAGLQLPDVHLCALKALENDDIDLLRARANRTLVEYYFTLTPCLPLYIFNTRTDITRLTYVDADLFFFADPQPILDELGENVIGVIEHRFPTELADLRKHGRFNVGWLTFRRDPIALACLQSWREQCLDWCYDKLEADRFAEQKYLDDWPNTFGRVRIIEHRGANVAPWNLNRFEISVAGEEVKVGGEPLVFYHAHGFRPKSPGHPRTLNLDTYRVQETPLLLSAIVDPYEQALVEATADLATPLALALLADDQFRDTTSLLGQLSAIEVDRAARLDVIRRLETQLAASDADRAARLEVIGRLHAALDESNADRAARLDAAQRLQAQLDVSEADRAARLDVIQRLQAELETLAARREHLTAERERLRDDLGQAHFRLDAIKRSRSWRWTRPIRWIANRLRQRTVKP
jgi:cell division protein FtsB